MSQDQRREREETMVGWQSGQYKKADSGREWRLRLLIFGIGLLCICSMVVAAVAAYYYV